MELTIPYKWEPRQYQKPLLKALIEDGFKRAVYVWHRRAGKDLFGLNLIIYHAIRKAVGTYWHVFPSYKQGKRAIWNETDGSGRKYLDYIPRELIKNQNSQEMKIEFVNGSIYQIVGSDDVDSLRGAGIKGAVFSEYAEQRPSAWEVIQPMLMATKGFAIFNFTPKGQNHAYGTWEMAKVNDKWYSELLTVEDTKEEVFSNEQIEEIKTEFIQKGKTLDLFNQEYYCSFQNAIEGAYYAQQMKQAEEEGRITKVYYEKTLSVQTWWDLGVNDANSIWFTQQLGNEIRVIDYIEDNNKGLDHYIKEIKNKPYVYERHNAPHDIEVREYTSGRSRRDIAYDLGIDFDIVPNIPVEDGINCVRATLDRCIFDQDKCKQGISSLKNYKKEFDEKKNCFKKKPLHDWSSNGADAFRYMAVGIDQIQYKENQVQQDYY